ncbi:cobalt ABC transporter permease [Microbacterium lushaniae]|nr:cobalt ABC transporter permease [Microbacterium lushaniae]
MVTPSAPQPRISTRAFFIGAAVIALVIACIVSVWASSHPDGLEFVAETTGFLGAARDSATAGSPLADYGVAVIENPWLSVALAGAAGCAVTFALAWVLGRAATRRRNDS